MTLDLDGARERFEESTDFTIGLEEEFAILDPQTLELEHRFEDVIAACVAQSALDYDEHGYEGAGAPLADREIEENLWRAIRYGAGGRMIDFRRGAEVPTRALLNQVLVWTEPARAQLGLDLQLPERNGAQRAREALDAGISIEDVYRDAVAETRRTYAGAAARQSA